MSKRSVATFRFLRNSPGVIERFFSGPRFPSEKSLGFKVGLKQGPRNLAAVTLLLLLLCRCSGTLFKELGSHFAAPIAIAVDPANNRAYLVNSNNAVEFTSASLSILDTSNPAAPVLLDSTANPISLPNFSGQIYFDPATRLAFIPNRASDGPADTSDNLLRVILDEGSPSFGTVESFAIGENPFGIACCDSSGRGLVVNSGGSLVAFAPSDPASMTALSLTATLSDQTVTGKNSREVALSGTQAFVTNENGLIYVIAISEIGSSAQPIDYLLTNTGAPRGIATDGTNLLVVDGSTSAPLLRVIPLSSLPLVATDVALSEVNISSVQSRSVSLGTDPNEVIVFGGRAYLSNRGADSVSVIDLASFDLLTTISVGDEPFGMVAFTALNGNSYLYVTNLADNSLSVVDLASNSVVTTLSL